MDNFNAHFIVCLKQHPNYLPYFLASISVESCSDENVDGAENANQVSALVDQNSFCFAQR